MHAFFERQQLYWKRIADETRFCPCSRRGGAPLKLKSNLDSGFLGGPALKRIIIGKIFSGALKRSFPRMNAGAPTEEQSREELGGVFARASAEAHYYRQDFFRSAEALLPPHECGGSHQGTDRGHV
jgi:hypothetical protein